MPAVSWWRIGPSMMRPVIRGISACASIAPHAVAIMTMIVLRWGGVQRRSRRTVRTDPAALVYDEASSPGTLIHVTSQVLRWPNGFRCGQTLIALAAHAQEDVVPRRDAGPSGLLLLGLLHDPQRGGFTGVEQVLGAGGGTVDGERQRPGDRIRSRGGRRRRAIGHGAHYRANRPVGEQVGGRLVERRHRSGRQRERPLGAAL